MPTKHRYFETGPEIATYVKTILALDANGLDNSSDLPVVTKGMAALFYKERANQQELKVFGQSVDESEFHLHDDTKIVVIFFNPFALSTIFKLDAHRLKQHPQGINLGDWNEKETGRLLIRLMKVNTMPEKVDTMTMFVRDRIASNRVLCEIILHATDKMMENPNPETIGVLPGELNITERTFQRIFKKYVGITPNEYRRICQFQQAFFQLRTGTFQNQLDVAHSNGYFDQSHYIRSFKEFADTTPSDYLQTGLDSK